MEAIKIHCPHCKRYLCETKSTLIASNVKCGGCKNKVNIKVVFSDSKEEDIHYKFDTIEE